ncbi:MAG: GldG family protein, partial [Proteobacteria bacterium]|nr:GldG family protein [Pseudomonadota bacterium]
MEMNPRTRWYLRLQNVVFVVLVLALLGTVAWLGQQYNMEFDWTMNRRNSLTQDSIALLKTLDAPVQVTAYASDDETLRGAIENLVRRYQREKADVTLQFVNPDLAPEQARAAGIRFNGTLVIHYKGRREQLSSVNEATVSEAIARLSRERETWVVFMTGHGERAIDGRANFDLALLGAELRQQGFRIQASNLATNPLPDNTALLVIAGPRNEWLPSEAQVVGNYLERGGNLLWLADPEGVAPLPQLAQRLGVEIKPGVVIDATTQLVGVADPTVAVVAEYPEVEPVAGFRMMTLFPRAAALAHSASGWNVEAILRTTPNSWRETGILSGNVIPGEGDEEGPLVIGFAMERTVVDDKQQRVVVVGDQDTRRTAAAPVSSAPRGRDGREVGLHRDTRSRFLAGVGQVHDDGEGAAPTRFAGHLDVPAHE